VITELATRSVHGARFTAELRTVFGEFRVREIQFGEIQA
jgi:hypothetical protein